MVIGLFPAGRYSFRLAPIGFAWVKASEKSQLAKTPTRRLLANYQDFSGICRAFLRSFLIGPGLPVEPPVDPEPPDLTVATS
jgi:hypothetical protein